MFSKKFQRLGSRQHSAYSVAKGFTKSTCAAYPKEIKLRMFPNMNTTTPAEVHYHHIIAKILTVGIQSRKRLKMMKNHHKKYISAGLKE